MRPIEPSDRIEYIRDLFAPEDPVLQAIQQRIETRGLPIHIGAEEGKLLQLFIRMHQVSSIVEIGTLMGYSTIWMARALPPGGHIHTIEKMPDAAALAREGFAESEVNQCITLWEGEAEEILPRLAAKGPFDMVFIDADKLQYLDYLDWAEEHIRPGGLIIADNTFLFGAVYKDNLPEGVRPTTCEVMRKFNRRLADPERYHSVMIPTKEGLTVAIKQ